MYAKVTARQQCEWLLRHHVHNVSYYDVHMYGVTERGEFMMRLKYL